MRLRYVKNNRLIHLMAASILLTLTTPAFASGSKNHDHKHKHKHSHKAHAHGQAEVFIAFDKEIGKLEMNSPAESILGFEQAAASEEQKKIISEQFSKIEANISNLFAFDSGLSCSWVKSEITQVLEPNNDKHSDVKIVYNIKCSKSPLGTLLQIDLSTFPRIKKAKVTFLADQSQLSDTYKGSPLIMNLK